MNDEQKEQREPLTFADVFDEVIAPALLLGLSITYCYIMLYL